MKYSLVKAVDMIVCKVCEKAKDGEDSDTDYSIDLNNGVHLDYVRKFGYLENMLNWVEEQIPHLCQGHVVCGGGEI